MIDRMGLRAILATVMGVCLQSAALALDVSEKDVEKAYAELTSASQWREAKAASDRLTAFGETALPTLLKGTKHEGKLVRQCCYDVLRSKFPRHEKSIQAIISGLNDKEQSICYPCAFHLGEHRIAEAQAALERCLKDESKEVITHCAAAKSLAELGCREVTVFLYTGLGSDYHYTRYLSNIGIKALCGKDLTDFGYQGPWEGAMVSGPAVYCVQGQPLRKAQNVLGRWQAIVKFLQWLEKDKPELFKELDRLW